LVYQSLETLRLGAPIRDVLEHGALLDGEAEDAEVIAPGAESAKLLASPGVLALKNGGQRADRDGEALLALSGARDIQNNHAVFAL
jgi:hypothetical protein